MKFFLIIKILLKNIFLLDKVFFCKIVSSEEEESEFLTSRLGNKKVTLIMENEIVKSAHLHDVLI